MSDTLFPTVDLEPFGAVRPGYRLDALEVYNWGTFDGRVFRLELGGDNTLLTGDIGSGKSTLVDAVTTLLLPANKINYNKAAGADTRERSLRSYVLGHYKSERVESSGASRPVGLRDQRHYSVVLGVFTNEGHDAAVTLAQVFWMRDTSQGQPHRFFVTAERAMSVAADFADFGTEIGALKRRLRAGGAAVSDHFPEYGLRLRRLLGISSEQALDLLHQTISMKSVGNLTDFVRQHMLEGADSATRIDTLVSHFDDLTQAHDAVRRARDQLAQLEPLISMCDVHDALQAEMESGRLVREALPYRMAEHKLTMLDLEQRRVEADVAAAVDDEARAGERAAALRAERERLVLARDGAGGARVAELERLLLDEAGRRDERRHRFDGFSRLVTEATLPAVTDAASFARGTSLAAERRREAEQDVDGVVNRHTELAVEQNRVRAESTEVGGYLRSLRGRQSNIDQRSLEIRERLAEAVGIPETGLPFVGELVQVRPEHAAWQGAAERVLRGFALSVLVSAEHYDAASAWIDSHHLGGRLVYYRVSPRITREVPPLNPHQILADLLEVKPGPLAEWVQRELGRRADHVCAASLDELREHRRAVTVFGLVKSDGRHEKDDRFRIDDRTRWVLGWSNEDKVDALMAQAADIQRRLTGLDTEIEAVRGRDSELRDTIRALDKLSVYASWPDLDWHSSASAVTRLEEEKRRLEHGNQRLTALSVQIQRVDEELAAVVEAARGHTERGGELRRQLTENARARAATTLVIDSVGEPDLQRLRAAYSAVDLALGPMPALDECDRRERDQVSALTEQIEKLADRRKSVGERVVRAMQQFRQDWPAETGEMDADLVAAAEYRALRERIATDDLPRFEAEFKKQLNTNVINDIAGFHAWLDRTATQIRERIDTINDSLRAIEYNPGRLITLLVQPTTHQEIRSFRDELRACTDDALVDDDQYSEERFLRVKRIIERFRGREGQTDADRRWTHLVTDVRNWFVFAASERWRETGQEYEHYTDSDGKSGGQKEKLAYTILAASLAYQFRLEWGVARSKDFRFAVIDEAFGRGSDLSTRYALELFSKLGLQLLIVTPLQKVHVIEPYVHTVGFVENRSGERSRLQTLTIEDFRRRRERHAATTAAARGGDEGVE